MDCGAKNLEKQLVCQTLTSDLSEDKQIETDTFTSLFVTLCYCLLLSLLGEDEDERMRVSLGLGLNFNAHTQHDTTTITRLGFLSLAVTQAINQR